MFLPVGCHTEINRGPDGGLTDIHWRGIMQIRRNRTIALEPSRSKTKAKRITLTLSGTCTLCQTCRTGYISGLQDHT